MITKRNTKKLSKLILLAKREGCAGTCIQTEHNCGLSNGELLKRIKMVLFFTDDIVIVLMIDGEVRIICIPIHRSKRLLGA